MNKIVLAIVFLLCLPALSSAQQKNAFIDPTTGVLKAVGYVEANGAGDIKIPVATNFNLKPGEWKWDGKNWTAVTLPLDPLTDLAFAIDAALAAPNVAPEVKIVLLKLRNVLGK
jgi:hypothetical protein